jgi:transposase, IS30 family
LSTYHQLTSGERYELSALRKQGLKPAAIARALGRHRSTIWREIKRNSNRDGAYRPSTADQMTRGRRSRSRRNQRFTAADWSLIDPLIREDFSPEQISGWLRRRWELSISRETIYRHILAD